MALFYTLEEAASLLGTSTYELRNRIQSKQVHAFLIGGSWRLRIADVHNLMGHSETSVRAPVPHTVGSQPRHTAFPALESTPPVPLPNSVPPVSVPESVRPASPLESTPQASIAESLSSARDSGSVPQVSIAQPVTHASIAGSASTASPSESVAEALVPESPPSRSPATSAEPSPCTVPSGAADIPSVELLRESLNRVLQLARSQGLLVEPNSISHLRDEEPTGNLGHNGSEDEPELSGPSRLEELFNLALKFDHDEQSEEDVSNDGSVTEPSTAQALNLEESKNDSKEEALEAHTTPKSKSASGTGRHSEAADLEGRPRETTAPAKTSVTPLELPKAKGSRIGQGGFFPVECPSCQALGQVPPNRMDQQLKCAECGTKFYLDLITNETVIGEKVTTKVAEPVADKKPTDSKGISSVDSMTSLPQSTWLRIAVMALVTIGLALGLFYFWPRVGNTPGDRTAEILQALTHNAPGRVAAIAVPSTRADVKAWFKKARPKDWPEVLPEVPVDINVLSKKQTRATTTIDFPPSVAVMPGSQEDPSGSGKGSPARSEFGKKSVGPRGLSLLLSWRYQNGQWLFDATESLKKTYPPR